MVTPFALGSWFWVLNQLRLAQLAHQVLGLLLRRVAFDQLALGLRDRDVEALVRELAALRPQRAGAEGDVGGGPGGHMRAARLHNLLDLRVARLAQLVSDR